MEMLVIAVLLGLSWALILTARIAKALDMHYKTFLWLGILFCFTAGIPLFSFMILRLRKDPESMAWGAFYVLLPFVFDLIAVFTSKWDVMPPCASVKRPGRDSVARTAKGVAFFLLMVFVLYFAIRGSLPSLGRMSGWDMVACGFFIMAGVIRGFQNLFLRVEICGNGLLDPAAAGRPFLKPWEAHESFSWTEETKDGIELTLQAKSAGDGPTPLMVRLEDREVVQQSTRSQLA